MDNLTKIQWQTQMGPNREAGAKGDYAGLPDPRDHPQTAESRRASAAGKRARHAPKPTLPKFPWDDP